MYKPLIYGNVMLLADVIAMLPLCLQLMFFCLADVIAMLLCCFRMDGDVHTIRLMLLPCWQML